MRPRLPDSHFMATCTVCGCAFCYADTRAPRKTCSPQCFSERQSRAGKARPLLRVQTRCRECGRAFEVAPHLVGTRTLCSPECKHHYLVSQGRLIASRAKRDPRIAVTCENCGAVQHHPPSIARTRRFCSRTCQYIVMRGAKGAGAGGGAWMRGTNNPNWTGTDWRERRATYRECTSELNQWRRRVFARDAYTCQECGISPAGHNQLRAHHIKPWATHPDLRLDIDNGLTLCHSCHIAIHRYPSGLPSAV
jgi:5-methylcytosine-specific restriction endonuclease McrA